MRNLAILTSTPVIPAHAGIQKGVTLLLDSRMRGNDGKNRARS